MEQGFWEKLTLHGVQGKKKSIMAMAPMSGVTDEAFRLMLLKYGKPSVFWTEFVAVEGLFHPRGKEFCLPILEHSSKEKPIVAQIFGRDPIFFEKAALLVKQMGFDGIDINMGCPDRAIEKQGAGSILIKDPKLAKEIIRATKKGAGKIPVSVKTRIGYETEIVDNWIKAVLEEEPAALTIHFRTRNELYLPPAHWELAEKIVKLRNKHSLKTLILGNGDIKTLEEAKKAVNDTGIDGVMIGRALVGDPWFFSGKIPTIRKRLKAIVEHAEIFEKLHKKEMKNGRCEQFESMKKHFHAYTSGFRGAKELREKLMKVKNAYETKKVIGDFIKNI